MKHSLLGWSVERPTINSLCCFISLLKD